MKLTERTSRLNLYKLDVHKIMWIVNRRGEKKRNERNRDRAEDCNFFFVSQYILFLQEGR